ncbi:prephenate dehydrogenase [Tundrisphaera lichenicola]|uniref:prephenate dehydrogenase n=1 Tax=Tundrisphaera lichenicola TaxID=2029860 RepID=UPI003EB697AC
MKQSGTVAIVGVGLIGGSIGLALRSKSRAARVIGIGRDRSRLEEARRLGAIDDYSTDMAEGVAHAEVAVICTPVTRLVEDALEAARFGPESILVTDAGSTKARIVEGVEANARGRAAFVGAHPIAGSERQGVAHARADLFEGRSCVLTPTDRTPPDRLERARAFWTGLGCRLFEIDPATHDNRLARTSHLPHAVAAALAASIPPEMLPMAAGAYRDGTRVAGADAGIWTAIFLENPRPILNALNEFESHLADFRDALESGDEARLRAWWEQARGHRSRFDHADPDS